MFLASDFDGSDGVKDFDLVFGASVDFSMRFTLSESSVFFTSFIE